jgi:HlyD family secretion protein
MSSDPSSSPPAEPPPGSAAGPPTTGRLAAVLARQALSTPDQLDQLFVVVGRRGWVALLAITVLLTSALLWACLAKIPETVQGAGLLVGPLGARPLQASYEGQVIEVKVHPGDHVEAEQELAVVNLPDLNLQLRQADRRLDELAEEDTRQQALETLRTDQEKTLRESQIVILDKSIKEAEELLTRLEDQTRRLIESQREKTAKSRKESTALRESLVEKMASSRRLAEQRLLSGERLLEMESRLLESSLSMANLDMRLAEIDLKEVENAQAIALQRNRLTDLKVQRLQLDTRGTQVKQEIAQARATRLVLRQEQQDRLRRLKGMIKEFGVVRSPQAGRVTELLLQLGQTIQSGARIGTLELESGAVPLTHLAYFPVAAGKRIRLGDEVRVTPTTVQRERYGSMKGTVRRVSSFPITRDAAATMLGNPELVTGLLPAGGVIEVEVELEPAATASGYRWTSAGPPRPVTAGTTAVTRVKVEERAPITYLLPVLRSLWQGQDPS